MHKRSEFQKLLAASFISQTGSHFLTLALVAFVLYSSGSPVQSALIFVVSFLPSILVSAGLGNWVDRNISRWLIARNELLSIIATLLSGLSIALHMPLVLLCVILGFRSLLMFVSRAAATKWLKVITPPELQTNRIKLFYLGFFLSTAFSGILAGLVLSRASIWAIVGLDAASYLLGVAIIMTLKPLVQIQAPYPAAQVVPPPSLRQTLSTIFQMPAVRTSFLIVCLSQALFQGAYSALVSYLPIQLFKIGLGGVGSFQVAASIGITGGFVVNWLRGALLSEKKPTLPIRAMGLAAAAIFALLLSVMTTSLPISLGGFLVLNLAYECVWLHHSSEFFRAAPKSDAARYQFTLSACAAFLMSASTLAYSAGIQYFGTTIGVSVVLALGVVISLIVPFVAQRPGVLSNLERTPS